MLLRRYVSNDMLLFIFNSENSIFFELIYIWIMKLVVEQVFWYVTK